MLRKRTQLAAALLLGFSAFAVNANTFKEGADAFRQGDYQLAYSIWLPLAATGDATAQRNLGTLFQTGRGVAQSYVRASQWYQKAADQGSAAAQHNLGMLYLRGNGVEVSNEAAARWFELAAEQDYVKAQNNLASMYAKGEGVDQSFVTAYVWFSKAADQGSELARTNRDIVAEALSPKQLEQAKSDLEKAAGATTEMADAEDDAPSDSEVVAMAADSTPVPEPVIPEATPEPVAPEAAAEEAAPSPVAEAIPNTVAEQAEPEKEPEWKASAEGAAMKAAKQAEADKKRKMAAVGAAKEAADEAAKLRKSKMATAGAEKKAADAAAKKKTEMAKANNAPATASAGNADESLVKDGQYGPVRSGDTLWSISRLVRPSRQVSEQQVIMAIVRINSRLSNVNGLQQGVRLRIPTLEQAQEISHSEALSEYKRQLGQ